jgi:hypothetical protein
LHSTKSGLPSMAALGWHNLGTSVRIMVSNVLGDLCEEFLSLAWQFFSAH